MLNETKNVSSIDIISDCIGYYLITIVSSMGLILNLIGIKMMLSKSLKHDFYKFLLFKTTCDSLVCLFGIGYLNNDCLSCLSNTNNTYGALFYQLYIIKMPVRVTLLVSALAEIYLTFKRMTYLSINNQSNSNVKKTKNIPNIYIMLNIILFPISIAVLPYFAIQIKEINQTGIYFFNTTNFGKSEFYRFYALGALVAESVLPIMLLTLLNLGVLVKFKKRMKKKLRFCTNTADFIKRSEINFTKMILILTGVFIITHFLDLLGSIENRLILCFAVEFTPPLKSILNLFRQLTYLFLYIQYAFNIVIYIANDQNLLKAFRELWPKKFNFYLNINKNKRTNVSCLTWQLPLKDLFY